jgi:hypothetical protein
MPPSTLPMRSSPTSTRKSRARSAGPKASEIPLLRY